MKTQNGSGAMFDGIAKKYDLLNKLTSMGMDKLWRLAAVKALEISRDAVVLDLAAGTLDVSMQIVQHYPGSKVIAADPSLGMLLVGKKKLVGKKSEQSIFPFIVEGENLSFLTDSFDGAVISFGIRNFVNRKQSLAELARVLKPGSRLSILELNMPQKGLMAFMARTYVKNIIPFVGGLLSGREAYKYLPDSMLNFPSPDSFVLELEDSGFQVVTVKPFMFGVCNLFVLESVDNSERDI